MDIQTLRKALETIEGWKDIAGLPAQVAELKARVDALEALVKKNATVAVCPLCGTAMVRVDSGPKGPFAAIGITTDTYRCPGCSHEEERQRDVLDRRA